MTTNWQNVPPFPRYPMNYYDVAKMLNAIKHNRCEKHHRRFRTTKSTLQEQVIPILLQCLPLWLGDIYTGGVGKNKLLFYQTYWDVSRKEFRRNGNMGSQSGSFLINLYFCHHLCKDCFPDLARSQKASGSRNDPNYICQLWVKSYPI